MRAMDSLILCSSCSCHSQGEPPPPPPAPGFIRTSLPKPPQNQLLNKKPSRAAPVVLPSPAVDPTTGAQGQRQAWRRREKPAPDPRLLLASMKSCGDRRDADRARLLFAQARDRLSDAYIATSLLSMLAKCGLFEEARSVLEQLPRRNVVAWNALISGYVHHGHHDEALACFRQMSLEGVSPSVVTFICLLKSCGSLRSLAAGESIHREVRENGLLERDAMLATTLLNMYAKCGVMEKAQHVFDELPVRNVVSWSALIAGYAQHGRGHDAIECFKRMKEDGVSPNAVTFTCVLKACGSQRCVGLGEEIHAEVKEKGLLKKDVLLGNTLVDMYAKCGVLEKAQEVFEEIPNRDVVSWNTLISGYTQHGHGDAALRCFRRMRDEGISLDAVSFICTMKACGLTGCLEIGEEIHAKLQEKGWLAKDIVIGTALLDMYCKCGALEKAHEVFEGLQERSVVSWNALIAGYVQHARGVAALSCFRRMQDEGISPDSVSFASILKACGSIGALEIGQWIHSQITDQGLLEDDIVLATALVDMYAKCGLLVRAREAFELLPVRNVVVWSALIAGYVQHGHGDEAMECFRKMQDEGVYPNFVTFISVLKACGIIGCLEVGESLHVKIKQWGLLENEIVLGNALVDMYAKCGSLKKAQEVFEMIPNQSVVAWNALICGQSQMGRARKVFDLFDEMRERGILPDLISFLILLSACSHAGFVEEAQVIFDDMCHVYRLNPELEHMSCMVDLFGRAGRFDKLKGILTKLSNIDYLPLFAALLGACCKWVNVELGKWAFEKLVRLDGQRAASYVCMRNIYEAAGMDAEAVQLSLSAEETWQRK